MNQARSATRTRRALLWLLTSACWLPSACNLPSPQEDSVRQFTLSGPAPGPAVTDAVVVRPVRLAGHLRNRAMAVRVSAHEIIYLEDVRWAEPLDEAVTQILRNRLRQVGGGGAVTVQVQRCELVRSENDAVVLDATYVITPLAGEVRPGAFTASPRRWDGKDHAVLVGLMHDAIAELADHLAQAIEQK